MTQEVQAPVSCEQCRSHRPVFEYLRAGLMSADWQRRLWFLEFFV